MPTVLKQSVFDDIVGHKFLQEHCTNLKHLDIFMDSAVV